MDIKEAKHYCEIGAFLAFAWAFFSALFITINLLTGPSEGSFLLVSLQYCEAGLISGLGVALLYYSRIAGMFLSALMIIHVFNKIFILGHIMSIIIPLILLYYFVRAARGAFSYHNHQKENKNLERQETS